jgi:hypothetical protein
VSLSLITFFVVYGWLVCVVGWKLVACVYLGGHSGKLKPKVQIVTPSSIYDDGVLVWSCGSGLAGLWSYGLDFWFGLLVLINFAQTRMRHATEP